jgi:phage tail sheath gpL-like
MAAEIDFFSNDSYGLNGTGSINLTGTVAASGVVNLLAGVMTYIPNAGFIGSDSFQYEVCDADGDCEVATVTMTVTIPPSQ